MRKEVARQLLLGFPACQCQTATRFRPRLPASRTTVFLFFPGTLGFIVDREGHGAQGSMKELPPITDSDRDTNHFGVWTSTV